MATTDELLDALMKDCRKPEDLIGENGLLKQLSRKSPEQAKQAEITEALGCFPQEKRTSCLADSTVMQSHNVPVITRVVNNSA